MGLMGFLDFVRRSRVSVASFGLDKDGPTAVVLKAFAAAPRLLIVEVVNILDGDIPDERGAYQASHRKYKYHLDKLVADGYLSRDDKCYVLTKRGRDFLVAAGFSIPDLWASPILVPTILFILSIPFVLIGLSGWKVIWYSVQPTGIPSVVEHSLDMSKIFFAGGTGLVGLGLGVLLGRSYAR